MKYQITRHGDLLITVDRQEQNKIKAMINEPGFHSDDVMYDTLEPLICNSNLSFCNPEDIGALTSAPCLCTRNDDMEATIDKAWAFMDYQVRSVQEDLAETGQAIFQHG